MQRILRQAKQLKPKHAALFLLVAAAVAAIAYFAGSEAQVEQRVEAGTAATQERPAEPPQQDDEEASESTAEPLTLTLTASRQICETAHARGYSSDSTGWYGVAKTPITWSVTGGTAPYTLVIDGETRDAEQTYVGPSGTASVSCAMSLGETFIEDEEGRRYRAQPEVDSGLKTIRATVTDAAGVTADDSAQVYVILAVEDLDHVMKSGETYRVHGWLVTVPDGVDTGARHGYSEQVCENVREDGTVDASIICEDAFHLGWAEDGYRALVTIGIITGKVQDRSIWREGPGPVDAVEVQLQVGAQINQLTKSIGQAPELSGN